MYNAWNGRPFEYKGSIPLFRGQVLQYKGLSVSRFLSDGAGSFVAEWRIVNGMPIRTVLTDSDDIISLFMKNIDPPEYD
jgi:hypothetical protein